MSCPDENQLALLCEGAIEAGARAGIEAHLDGCAACTELFRELAAVVSGAGARDASPSLPERYRLVRRLGRGAMGEVWEADDRHLVRRVAIKLLRPELVDSAAHRAALLAEARVLAGLSHPALVPVHDAGLDGDTLWIAMAYVGGLSARAWRAQREPSWREVLAVWLEVAAGLDAAHRAGVVHRDVKPDNVIVAPDGRAALGDFGLAQSARASFDSAGTPVYMAPEILAGGPADARADQFALCASAWEQLAGARPFRAGSMAALRHAMAKVPRAPHGSEVPRAVWTVLQRGLSPEPDARWPSLQALRDALDAASRSRPRRAWRRFAVAALLVAVPLGVRLGLDRDGGEGPSPQRPVPRLLPSNSVRAQLDRATNALTAGQPRACLGLLDGIDSDVAVGPDDPDIVRGLCQMAAGECAVGRATLTGALTRAGRAADDIAAAIDGYDAVHCPLDAPASAALLRQRYQAKLSFALGRDDPGACKTLVASLAERALEPIDAWHDVAILGAHCAARAGDCELGEALVVRAEPDDEWARSAQLASLQKSFPGCAGR